MDMMELISKVEEMETKLEEVNAEEIKLILFKEITRLENRVNELETELNRAFEMISELEDFEESKPNSYENIKFERLIEENEELVQINIALIKKLNNANKAITQIVSDNNLVCNQFAI